jgi:hypothetical protein
LYFSLFGNPAYPWGAAGISLFFILLTGIYFYFFLKSWKKVTVGPNGVVVDYLAFKKQLVVPYTAMNHIGTYNLASGSAGRFRSTQSFVIEFEKGTREIRINESHYDNYTQLKAAVYNYTLGFDRQRSQY